MLPWRNRFHCSGSTYGTWLPGDPRGRRSRHDREHVEGDCRHPTPTGKYGEVLLDWGHRVIACREMARTLLFHDVERIDLSVGAAHDHVLARFTPVGRERSPGTQPPQGDGKMHEVNAELS